MSYSTSYYNASNIIILLLLSFFTISITLVGMDSEAISSVASVLTYSIVGFLIIFYFNQYGAKSKIDKRLILLSLLAAWVGVRAINLYGVGLLFQALFLFAGALVLSNLNFYNKISGAIFLGGLVYVFLALTHFFVNPIFTNTNYIGVCGLIFCVSFFSRQTKICYLLSFICFLIVFFSGTRSALLGLVFAYFVYKIFSQKTSVKIFSLILLMVVTFVFFNNGYYDYLNSDSFAKLILDKTGKRLESGRFEIWNSIFSNMSFQDYIFGLGGGTNYEQIIGSKLSAHSGYVYIISSYGIVGLILFILASLFSLINLFKNGYYFSFLLFVALLFREFFEVTLLHNSFPIALFFWAFLSNGYLDMNKRFSEI